MASTIFKFILAVVVLISGINASLFPTTRDREPSYKEYAKMARFLVHKLDWSVMATISIIPAIKGYPMVGVISYADSAIGENSTGEIYMMLTNLDIPEKDLLVDNKLTMLFSMAQYKNCSDAMEPTCARLMITGSMKRIEKTDPEYDFGLNAMLSRHPVAQAWSIQHGFYLAKVEIQRIMIQDFYGRPNVIPVDEYFAADPTTFSAYKSYRLQGRRRFFPAWNPQ